MSLDDPRVPPPFALGVGELQGTKIIAVGGELDLHTAAELEKALAAVNGARLIVDLREVTFLDSTALAVLLRAAKDRAAQSLDLDLVIEAGDVRRVFEITGLAQRFAFSTSVEQALAR